MFAEWNEKHAYRRQYILAPGPVQGFPDWNHRRISEEYSLATHPDLPVTFVARKDAFLCLLGYIIDARDPRADDSKVMQAVIDDSRTLDDVFSRLVDKCGRFVVIAGSGKELRVFSDACGLRQVFYSFDGKGRVWCSSQPHLIAERLGFGIDEEIKKDLSRSPIFRTVEHWYPGKITLLKGVYHLLPNHYLDASRRAPVRYWPVERLDPLTVSECVPKVLPILRGILEGAANRYNLAFAISGGYDSRTLLAASRSVAGGIHFITQTDAVSRETDPDVVIPSELMKRLGLRHSVLTLPRELPEDFAAILRKNVFTARTVKGVNALSVHEHFKNESREVVVVYGNCSEITKRDRFRFPKTPKPLLSGAALAAMALMNHSRVATDEFSQWLDSVKPLTRYNVDILDLMHWEQRVGGWGAMSFSEYDIVQESLCPYSCRGYIENMLRVPLKYRTYPWYKLHREIMAAAWPEVLELDINPERSRFAKSVKGFFYRTNLFDLTKFLFIMLYRRHKR